LTNMANALATVGLTHTERLYACFGVEAVRRADAMDPAELLRLFQVFLAAPPRRSEVDVVGLLAMAVVDRVESLRVRDLRVLSRILTAYFGLNGLGTRVHTREELAEWCAQLAQNTDGTACRALRKGAADELDVASVGATSYEPTEVPNSSIISSECTEEAVSANSDMFQNLEYSPQKDRSVKHHIKQSFFSLGNEPKASTTHPPQHLPSQRALDLNAAIPAPAMAPPSYIQAWIEETMQRVEEQSDLRLAKTRESLQHWAREQETMQRGSGSGMVGQLPASTHVEAAAPPDRTLASCESVDDECNYLTDDGF
jgi:hypothetical protein